MTEAQFRRELKNGLSGAYLLYGDGDYLKRFYASRAAAHILGEDQTAAAFNSYTIGRDAPELADLEEAVLSTSLFGDKIFIRYFADISKMDTATQKQLAAILEKIDPNVTVCLLIPPAGGFDPGKPQKNKPSAQWKLFSGVCQMVELSLYPPAELKKWMARRLARESIALTESGAQFMLDRCGRDMFVLSGELDKLSAWALAHEIHEIGSCEVAEVTSAAGEEDAFALANAVLAGDRARALTVLNYCKKRQEKAVSVMASVSKALCDMLAVSRLATAGYDKAAIASALKMHEYRAGLYLSAVRGAQPERIAAAVRRCRETDVLMKRSRLDYIAVERLICTIPIMRRKSER